MEGQDEWRVSGVAAGSLGEVLVVGWNNETKEEQRDYVKQGDTPEHLLGGLGDRLSWVGGFSSSKTDKLSSTERERGGHEHGAESLEAISERTRLVPVVCANVASGISWDTSTVDNNTEDDEADDCSDLDNAKNELDFTVAPNTKDVDQNNTEQEDCNPYTDIDGRSSSIIRVGPERNSNTGSR